MAISARLTTGSVTPRLNRGADSAEDSTTLSIFFVKFSAAVLAELEARSSRPSSAAWAAKEKTGSEERICATTCKFHSKKRLPARKRKSKFGNWMFATNATVPAQNLGRARSIVPGAAAAARSSARGDFSRYRKLVHDVGESARS